MKKFVGKKLVSIKVRLKRREFIARDYYVLREAEENPLSMGSDQWSWVG